MPGQQKPRQPPPDYKHPTQPVTKIPPPVAVPAAAAQAPVADRPREVAAYAVDPGPKVTKKAAAVLAQWNGKNRGRAIDVFFRGQAERARRKFGHSAVFVGDEARALVLGIPMPALAMEFVIGQNCFPLGLILQLVALAGVGKSAFLAELIRWFYAAGGGGVVCEAESKFNEDWYRSIMGAERWQSTELFRCKSIEDWQDKLTFSLNDFKNGLIGTADAPGPGRTVPIVYGIDSIMGRPCEENVEKIFGTVAAGAGSRRGKGGAPKKSVAALGHGTRDFPLEAMIITRYMRAVPAMLDGWPFALVLINHLREKKDDQGHKERAKTGGVQIDFQESFELELSKVGGPRKVIRSKNFEGYTIRIACYKNSFAPGERQILTRLLWWYVKDEATGEMRQETVFDWDWSTVHLLHTLLHGDRTVPHIKAALDEMGFHLECPSQADVENLAWSQTLGMTKDDAAPWTEVGAMIREDRKLTEALRTALRITRRPLLAGDYLQQLDGMTGDLP